MEHTDKIREVLKRKGSETWAIAPDAMIYEALEMMAAKNVGALLVMTEGRLVGILSERDYAREVDLQGGSSKNTPVRSIMTSPVTAVSMDHTVDECMRLMTDGHLRHLPVVEQNKVVGVVSIGDLVNWIITAQQESISHLQAYIVGKYPG